MVLEHDEADPAWLATQLCVYGTDTPLDREGIDESP
jgi:hypothetical protein